MPQTLGGLYVLTPDDCPHLLDAVSATISGGARMVQYRDKQASTGVQKERAQALLNLCRAHQVPLLINDDLELALAIGADGVHLGAGDRSIAAARARFPHGIIGASCYNDLKQATHAAKAGASYVAFGSFYPSSTQPDAVSASPDLLVQAHRTLRLPICAIGGLQPDNVAPLIKAGADLLAVSQGVFAAPDIKHAAHAIAETFPAS